MSKLTLPNNWFPRDYQLNIWNYLQNGGKRAVAVWHRRSGKDECALHWAACSSQMKPGNIWHMLPEYSQARKAIWDAVNPHTGKRRIDEAFPLAMRETTRQQEMFIKFKNGSTWQLVGSDNFDSLVGSPPVGVVFSEYALANPRAWAYIRPILAENNGWAMFIYTPRGANHGKQMYDMSFKDPTWYGEKLTVDNTDVFTPETLESELKELIGEYGEAEGRALFMQEYYCSFAGAVVGSYFMKEIETLEREKKITAVAHEPALPVYTAWDLGIGDATGIWFAQVCGNEVRIIDYLEGSGEGLPYYAQRLKERPYVYAGHIMPHDIKVRELGSGKSRLEIAESLGITPIEICPNIPVDDGINAVRMLLPRCWFDEKKTFQGFEALKYYHKDYDEKRREFKAKPYHDWSSHGADSFRYLAVGLDMLNNTLTRRIITRQKPNPKAWT